MIFADKLIGLRKKSGWSQEELAEKLGVTRQSVSKWEGAQSVPDLEKMLRLATIFGVTTDYLLRDEIESEGAPLTEVSEGRRLTLAEASAFLAAKDKTAKRIAIATYLCILSPVPMFILAAGSESGRIPITENAAGGIGMIALLVLAAIAVVLYLSCRTYTRDYDFLEKEVFDAEYGVEGMARERKRQEQESYSRLNILGASLCILSVVPLFAGVVFTEADFPMVLLLSLMFVIVGAGVACFILAGVPRESLDKLLQEGDYARDRKRGTLSGMVSGAYWMVATAVYLAYSFITEDWERSWIVWPVAGVLYGAVAAVCRGIENRNK